jgi:predicted nucleotidyltransferase
MLNHGPANELLSKFNVTVDDLLKEAPDVGENGALMLIGSVADGFGTLMSDIDLMVVGERRPDSDLVLREVGRERAIRVIDGGQEINIEYWDLARLGAISDKMKATSHALDNPRSTDEVTIFSNQELRIVHYLLSGQLLAGSKTLIQDLFDRETVIDYLIMYAATCHLAFAEDSIGQVMEEDYECAALQFRMAMEYVMAAEIASLGHTHPYLRWRLKFLKKCRPEIGEDVYREYLSYLFIGAHADRTDIENGLRFAQGRLMQIFMRRPRVMVAAGALGERMKFVTSFGSKG